MLGVLESPSRLTDLRSQDKGSQAQREACGGGAHFRPRTPCPGCRAPGQEGPCGQGREPGLSLTMKWGDRSREKTEHGCERHTGSGTPAFPA